MKPSDAFISTPVAGRMTPEHLAAKLSEIEPDTYDDRISKGSSWNIFGEPKIWESNAHAFGFIAEGAAPDNIRPIVDIGAISPDLSLANKRVNITLNHLRIAEYPGTGTHRILFDFYAKNQLAGGAEEVHFNTTYRVLEGERAGIKGYPIFVGLGVGAEGLSLQCFTVNVKNDDDEKFLSMLDSDVFKGGLKLALTAQPALAPLSGMAVALTKSIASRNRNIAVQDFFLGLDFSAIPGGGRLARGAYVAVQIPERDRLIWNWDNWIFNTRLGQIVENRSVNKLIPFNYVMFGISEHRGS